MAAIQHDDYGYYMQCGKQKQRIRYERIDDDRTRADGMAHGDKELPAQDSPGTVAAAPDGVAGTD